MKKASKPQGVDSKKHAVSQVQSSPLSAGKTTTVAAPVPQSEGNPAGADIFAANRSEYAHARFRLEDEVSKSAAFMLVLSETVMRLEIEAGYVQNDMGNGLVILSRQMAKDLNQAFVQSFLAAKKLSA
jgi:hypothetical protein